MEMYQFEAVLHVAALQYIDSFKKFRRIEAELALVATTLAPFARASARQLDAYAHIRPHLQPLRYIGDHTQLIELLHHQIYAAPHLLGKQRQLDIRLILIPIADYKGILGDICGKHSMQLRLRTGLKADIELLAVAHYLLHHRTHLIHLYRIDRIALPLIVVLLGSLTEAVRYFLDAIIQNIGKTKQHRSADVAHLKLVDHLLEVDRSVAGTWCHHHVPALIDRKIVSAPAGNIVQLLAVFDAPLSHVPCMLVCMCFIQLRLRSHMIQRYISVQIYAEYSMKKTSPPIQTKVHLSAPNFTPPYSSPYLYGGKSGRSPFRIP